jgi:peptidoglycan/LPS O-acetylase OafA/YrhL
MSANGATAKLGGIEAARGLAASVVVLYHTARHLDKLYGMPALMSTFQFGHAGVDLFFVISGFIILHVHYRDISQPSRLTHYIGRRFTRVMPTYWIALAITVLLATAGGHTLPTARDLLFSVSLLPSNRDLLLGIAWTLRFELVFYAIFCVLILRRSAGVTVLAVWLGVILTAWLATITLPAVPGSLYGIYNLEFFFGMAAAYATRNRVVTAPKSLAMIGIGLFAAAAIAENLGAIDGYADSARLWYGIPSALIVLGVAQAGSGPQFSVPKLLSVLGGASYSIYLFQFVFIGMTWKLWLNASLDRSLPHGLAFVPLAAAGILGGIAMSRYVEHPLIRMIRNGGLSIRPRAALG